MSTRPVGALFGELERARRKARRAADETLTSQENLEDGADNGVRPALSVISVW
jgi:hypothetical protein